MSCRFFLAALAVMVAMDAPRSQPLELDTDYGTNGRARISAGMSLQGLDMSMDSEGRALFAARVRLGQPALMIHRLNPDGTKDLSFGTAGLAYFTYPPGASREAQNQTADLFVDPNGHYALAGSWSFNGAPSSRPYLIRPDNDSYQGFSHTVVEVPIPVSVHGAASATSFTYLAADLPVTNECAVIRLNSVNKLDVAFSVDGIYRLPYPSAFCHLSEILVLGDRIYVAGTLLEEDNELVSIFVHSLGLDGSPVEFGTDGIVRLIEDGHRGGLHSNVVIHPWNGWIVIAGLASQNSRERDLVVAALEPDGRPYASFNGGDHPFRMAITGGAWSIQPGITSADGRLLVTFSTSPPPVYPDDTDASAIATIRFLSDGRRDWSVGDAGVSTTIVARWRYGKWVVGSALDPSDGLIVGAEHRLSGSDYHGTMLYRFKVPVSTSLPTPPESSLALAVTPTPTAGSLAVQVHAPRMGDTRLVLLDVLGRHLATLHDGPLASGEHRFPVLAGLASGTYVARLTTADGTTSVRFTVAR